MYLLGIAAAIVIILVFVLIEPGGEVEKKEPEAPDYPECVDSEFGDYWPGGK